MRAVIKCDKGYVKKTFNAIINSIKSQLYAAVLGSDTERGPFDLARRAIIQIINNLEGKLRMPNYSIDLN